MRVQTKLNILFFILSFLFIGGVLYQQSYENRRIYSLFKQDQEEKNIFLGKLLSLKGESIRTLAFDYTYWDEMVKFLNTKNMDWAKQNMDANVLETYKVDAIWVYEPDLSLVYSINREGIDYLKEFPLPKETIKDIFTEKRLRHFFINTKDGLFEVRGATIHPGSDAERVTPIQGYFFACRQWNQGYLAELSKLAEGEVEVSSVKRDIPPRNELLKSSTIIVSSHFNDLSGKPVAYLYVKIFSKAAESFSVSSKRSIIVFISFLIFILIVIAVFFTFSVSLPLVVISQALRGEDSGKLVVLEKDTGEFGDIARLIARFFEQRAEIIREITERKLAEEKATYINRLYSVLSNINQSIVRIRDQQELFQTITRIAVEEGLFRMAWIGLIDRDASLIRPVSHWGAEEGYLGAIVIPLESQGPSSTAIRERKPYICNDISLDPRMEPWREEALKRDYRSLASFPIYLGTKPVGVFSVYTSKEGFFDDREVGLLHELSIDISFALEHIEEEKKRKLAEAELMLAYEQLKTTQSQLVQSAKMASVGLLAGGVAHEINNPLTGVLNNVQLIKMMAEQKKDFSMDDFKDLLDVIEESAKRCTTITRSLLDFSHASKGIFQNLMLNEVVEKAAVLVEGELKLENINIQKELGAGQPQISGDFQLLEQAVFDLIANAKWAIQKKSGREGGSITIKTTYDSEAKQVLLYVTDTGKGITKENLERIFEPFFTTKAVGEGTGLGLSIVYGIIKEHQGNIEVESYEDKGTTFKISLPVV